MYAAIIPSMAFVSAPVQARMASWRRVHDYRASVTRIASEVSCSEMANRDKFGPSLFPLYTRKKRTKGRRVEEGVALGARAPAIVREEKGSSRTRFGPCRSASSWPGVDHLRGEIGRLFVIQVNDALKDAAVDDLLFLPLPGLLVHVNTLSQKPPISRWR